MKIIRHTLASLTLLILCLPGAGAQVTERQVQEAVAEAVTSHPSLAQGSRIQLTNVRPADPSALKRARSIQRVELARDQSPVGLITARLWLEIPSDPGVWIWVRARSRALVPTVVVIRDIARGTILSRADIEVVHKPPHAQGLSHPDHVVGKRARRTLHKGDRALESCLMVEPLVHRGDRLEAEVRRGGLLVRAPAVALNRGGAGEIIKLKIPTTGRIVQGRIVTRQRVEVIP